MKRIIAALCFFTACALSCATIPIVKDCAAVTVANLIDDVNTALATGDYVGELEKLIGSFVGCSARGVVVEAVREVAERAGVRGQYDELEALKAQRARAWLAAQPTGA